MSLNVESFPRELSDVGMALLMTRQRDFYNNPIRLHEKLLLLIGLALASLPSWLSSVAIPNSGSRGVQVGGLCVACSARSLFDKLVDMLWCRFVDSRTFWLHRLRHL